MSEKNRKILAVLFALGLLTGCWLPETTSVVVVAGDSIAEEASRDITSAMLRQDNAPIVVNNAIGGTMLQYTAYICGRLESLHGFAIPDAILMAFGTNDAAAMSPTFRADIDAMMACVDPSTTVYWVPPYISAQYTGHVIDAQAAWPNIHPVLFEPTPEQLWVDGIHLNEQGNAALTEALIGAMEAGNAGE